MDSMEQIKVFILDDHPVFVFGLESLLEETPSISVVGKAENATEAFRLIEKTKPEIVLADISMPGLNGIDFLQRVQRSYPDTKVIMLTALEEPDSEMRAFKLGAYAYVYKSAPSDKLIDTIKTVHQGNKVMTPEQTTNVLSAFETMSKDRQCEKWGLNPSDILVLKHLSEGENYKEIADALFVSETTVKRRVQSILDKMGVANRTHAVSLAIRFAII